jgi:uncharacterized protein (DUF2235 family)
MKRLIVCCDGTWQKLASPYPTNVVKIAQATKPIADDGTPQILFYDQGIGTGDKLDKLGGGAFGWGIDDKIQDAYRFLCLNYIPGDEIYLFGFSRGAYTVRSLAGLVRCSGLLSRQNIRKAPDAYKLYRNRSISLDDKTDKVEQLNGFKQEADITLLGCWDTVGSLGVPNQIPFLPIDDLINKKYRFYDTNLSGIIKNALHAVAIDEQRKVFNVTPMNQDPKHIAAGQRLRQVWFPGDHGSVGGGDERIHGLSDAALLWMIEQVQDLGLKLDLDLEAVQGGIHPDPITPFDNSLKGIYQLTGRVDRQVSGDFDGLHTSVKQRWRGANPPYRPKNLRAYVAMLNSCDSPIKTASNRSSAESSSSEVG